MGQDQNDFKSPAQLINSLLEERGWTKRVLSMVVGIDEATISKILSNKKDIDADDALLFEQLFDVPAERFLELQKTYDLAKAKITFTPDANMKIKADIYGGLPIAEMVKRGWISVKNFKNTAEIDTALLRFFEVNSLSNIAAMPHSAKKTNYNETPPITQLAWLKRVQNLAKEILVPKYSHEQGKIAAQKLTELLFSSEEARKAPRILAECGIRFLIVETLPSAKIDGVCFWLNDHSPVIALTTRFDRIDNFWFVLRHELEHVIQGHGKNEIIIDANLESEALNLLDISDEEKMANNAASEFCVPQLHLKAFYDRKYPIFSERDIIGFSRSLKIHAGLVAGQLRFKMKRYDRFTTHLVKIRHIVTPNCVTDGWGDIAPLEFE